MAIFHSPGAVESRDGVAIILGVLEKLCYIVSGDDTDGNVAGGDHFDDVSREEYNDESDERFVDPSWIFGGGPRIADTECTLLIPT